MSKKSKVVILAAGMGSRLGGGELPKPLTPLYGDTSLLGRQISLLEKHFSHRDIFITVGYCKEKIQELFPNLFHIFTPKFAQENTAKSLLQAFEGLPSACDVLWLNGDVVFKKEVLNSVLSEDRNVMVVNEGHVGEEEVKYTCDERGMINAVSKDLKSPLGEALGINFFKKDSLEKLKIALSRCGEQDYFEKAIEICIQEGMDVWPLCVEADACLEVDFPEDLERARTLIDCWGTRS